MTYLRKKLDISSYLVLGPENTAGRPVADVIRAALRGGFTCLQIRAKTASAREVIALCAEAARVREETGQADRVALLVDDRLDVVLAAREQGIPVDGVHVGQKDIPPAVCRRYLGPDSVVGLSARAWELLDYVKHADVRDVDYFGAGPLHRTATKPDSGLKPDGTRVTRTLDELRRLHAVSPVPVVVGGGVKARDIPGLKATGVDGFFVVSAVAGAADPYAAAKELTTLWNS
ncbi:MAG: thiamine phosphate synthase [Selenomonadaceae bacterium]|nr:thiamine phosphate synthase [Selenomonadaceae bacterium]MDY2684956.1 thiamine phosphate synthase [Selenomonadaceae bacterium]